MQGFSEAFNGIIRQLEHYDERPEQQKFSQAINDAIDGSYSLIAEAGTGVGKTLGYLIPSVLNKRKIVVSTFTKHLQEQIFEKDIPFINRYVRPVNAVVIKGMGNYLCRLSLAHETGLFGSREPGFDAWCRQTDTGDIAEYPSIPPFWDKYCASSDRCTHAKCPFFDDCFVFAMRDRALMADVVIANHALVVVDILLKKHGAVALLPSEIDGMIIDEAHELEGAATSMLEDAVTNRAMDRLLSDIGDLSDGVHISVALLKEGYRLNGDFVGVFSGDSDKYIMTDKELTPERANLATSYYEFWRKLVRLMENDLRRYQEVYPRVLRLVDTFENILSFDSDDHVYWVEAIGKQHDGLRLVRSPLYVGEELSQFVWNAYKFSVATSATLSSNGNFEYARDRLGFPRSAHEILVDSPFLYRDLVQFLVPKDAPDPKKQSTQLPAFIAELTQKIFPLLEGGLFVLCTSFANMRKIRNLLDCADFPVLVQGDYSQRHLVDMFREEKSVLIATRSFWQGVDIQGDGLQGVIIDKLPFAVPSDPIVYARNAQLGKRAFMEYSVPECVITLKQGVGRLVRSKTDKGILTICDNRLLTSGWGNIILKSLPDYGQTHTGVHTLIPVSMMGDSRQSFDSEVETWIPPEQISEEEEYMLSLLSM